MSRSDGMMFVRFERWYALLDSPLGQCRHQARRPGDKGLELIPGLVAGSGSLGKGVTLTYDEVCNANADHHRSDQAERHPTLAYRGAIARHEERNKNYARRDPETVFFQTTPVLSFCFPGCDNAVCPVWQRFIVSCQQVRWRERARPAGDLFSANLDLQRLSGAHRVQHRFSDGRRKCRDIDRFIRARVTVGGRGRVRIVVLGWCFSLSAGGGLLRHGSPHLTDPGRQTACRQRAHSNRNACRTCWRVGGGLGGVLSQGPAQNYAQRCRCR